MPGPLGTEANQPTIDAGTSCRQRTPSPGPVCATRSAARDPDPRRDSIVPGRAVFFVIVRDVAASGKLVRKVILLPETDINALVVNRPDLFGFHPRQPNSTVTPGEHALGNTLSKYLSASNKEGGAPNFQGTRWHIDIEKAKRSGVKIIETEEIVRDLDRIAEMNPTLRARIDKLKGVIHSVEGEVLMEGSVPKAAVQTAEEAAAELSLLRGMARGARVLGGVGVVLSVYDLGSAALESYETKSLKPVSREAVRQVGGWGGAAVGFETGFGVGALVGIETGPGALAFGLVGGLIFGAAGFLGADWVAHKAIR